MTTFSAELLSTDWILTSVPSVALQLMMRMPVSDFNELALSLI
jgi:hypothetical protein